MERSPLRTDATKVSSPNPVLAPTRHKQAYPVSGCQRVTTSEAARALAARLNGNARERPVVVVTTPHGRTEPWIDVEEIVDQVGDIAEI